MDMDLNQVVNMGNNQVVPVVHLDSRQVVNRNNPLANNLLEDSQQYHQVLIHQQLHMVNNPAHHKVHNNSLNLKDPLDQVRHPLIPPNLLEHLHLDSHLLNQEDHKHLNIHLKAQPLPDTNNHLGSNLHQLLDNVHLHLKLHQEAQQRLLNHHMQF